MMIVVGPAESEPVLTRFLDPCRTVARLPVEALGFEDKVTRQVARAGSFDDLLERGFSGVEPRVVVVESSSSAVPELIRRERLPLRDVRRPSAPPREVARKRVRIPRTPGGSMTASVVTSPGTRPIRYGPSG